MQPRVFQWRNRQFRAPYCLYLHALLVSLLFLGLLCGPEDVGTPFLRNVGELLSYYLTSCPVKLIHRLILQGSNDVYSTQNYWVFGLHPSSCILKTTEHGVQWLRLALSNGPNRVGVSPSHLRTETNPVPETLCFLVFRIPDDGQSPRTQ
jgi:hypothetical protein